MHPPPGSTDAPARTSFADASPAERAAAGKAARGDAPRSSHGEWEPESDRPDPVELLERQGKTRVAELVPIRYGRMLVSPLAFFRGAAAIMASDLAATARSGLEVQLCGDAHLENFGGSWRRTVTWSSTSTTSTRPTRDHGSGIVKRLAASFAVAGRGRGFREDQRRSAVQGVVREYREAMRRFAKERNLDVWYTRLDVSEILQYQASVRKKELKTFERNMAKARAKDSQRALSRLTRRVDGVLRIISDPPLIVPLEEVFPGEQGRQAEDQIEEILDGYRATLASDRRHLFGAYRHVHTARKVVGVGSVGTRCWIALFTGRDDQDPLFLQVKEAQASVLEPYTAPSEFDHHGQRVVEGQRLTQAASDIFLGWLTAKGPDGKRRDFYVRQLWDGKGSARVESISPARYDRVCTDLWLDPGPRPRPLR